MRRTVGRCGHLLYDESSDVLPKHFEKGMSSLSLILLVRVRLRSYTYTGKNMANTVTGSHTFFAVGMMSTQMK